MSRPGTTTFRPSRLRSSSRFKNTRRTHERERGSIYVSLATFFPFCHLNGRCEARAGGWSRSGSSLPGASERNRSLRNPQTKTQPIELQCSDILRQNAWIVRRRRRRRAAPDALKVGGVVAVSVFGAKPRRTDGRVDVGMHGGTGHLKSARPFQGEPLSSSSSSRDSGRETASAAFTNERTSERRRDRLTSHARRAPGPRCRRTATASCCGGGSTLGPTKRS